MRFRQTLNRPFGRRRDVERDPPIRAETSPASLASRNLELVMFFVTTDDGTEIYSEADKTLVPDIVSGARVDTPRPKALNAQPTFTNSPHPVKCTEKSDACTVTST